MQPDECRRHPVYPFQIRVFNGTGRVMPWMVVYLQGETIVPNQEGNFLSTIIQHCANKDFGIHFSSNSCSISLLQTVISTYATERGMAIAALGAYIGALKALEEKCPKSCVRCIHGQELTEYEGIYLGDCQHWEEGVRGQLIQTATDNGPPSAADLETVASQCPVWEEFNP